MTYRPTHSPPLPNPLPQGGRGSTAEATAHLSRHITTVIPAHAGIQARGITSKQILVLGVNIDKMMIGVLCSMLLLAMPVYVRAQTQDSSSTQSAVGKEGDKKRLFTPDAKGKAAIIAYIVERHNILDALARDTSTMSVDAQVSLNRYLNKQEFLQHVLRYPVQIQSFSIGWGEQVAGYEIRPEESLEEAVNHAAFHHAAFIDTLYESALAEKTDAMQSAETKQMDAAFLAQAMELKSQIKKNGTLFYGLKIKGAASELKKIKDTDAAVRLMDPLWVPGSDISQPERVKKIALPISPYQFDSSR